MKKIILCTVLLLAGMTLGAEARGSRTASKQNTSVTVVSDTTTNGNTDEADNTDEEDNTMSLQDQIDSAVQQAMNQNDPDAFTDDSADKNIGPFGSRGDEFVIWIVAIVFGFPVLLAIVILYFIYRNRKEKYELQKMAIEKGLNPNTVYYTGKAENTSSSNPASESKGLKKVYNSISSTPLDSITPNEVLWEKGIKQMCLGVGLAFLLGFIVRAEFAAIGVLVFLMGVGKAVIAKTRNNPAEGVENLNTNQHFDTTDKPESHSEDNKPDEAKEN